MPTHRNFLTNGSVEKSNYQCDSPLLWRASVSIAAINPAMNKRLPASNTALIGPMPWVSRNPLSKYRIRVVQMGGAPGVNVMAMRGSSAVTSSGLSRRRAIWLQLSFWLVEELLLLLP